MFFPSSNPTTSGCKKHNKFLHLPRIHLYSRLDKKEVVISNIINHVWPGNIDPKMLFLCLEFFIKDHITETINALQPCSTNYALSIYL